mgnify:CR=1 FL=1
MVKASERKMMAKEVMADRDVSVSLVCRTFLISETCYRYKPKLSNDNEKIADLLLGLTQNQRNWGIGGITPIQKLKLSQRKISTTDLH